MNAKESDDTEYDIPRRSINMDKDENTAIIQSTTQRIMAKTNPFAIALIPILLSGILVALVSIYSSSVEQPHIDAAQNTAIQVVSGEVVDVKGELSEVKDELKVAVAQLTDLNIKFAVLLAKME